ncbi:MAG: RtcB family protein, partial [Asgard group archaeon]
MKKEVKKTSKYPLERVDKFTWKLPRSYKTFMLVDGIVYSDEILIQNITKDRSLDQLANIASLKGILSKAIAMPDVHEGYGFPIGGVAAIDIEEGVISPGGVGFDINCGVRMLRSNLRIKDVKPYMNDIVNLLFKNVPSGLGSRGKIKLTESQLREVMIGGSKWALENGYGWEKDIQHCEESGAMKNADPSKVSPIAKKRGIPQLGSLGSGNHFLEVQVVDKIFDERAAKVFGIEEEGQITVLIHTGSRGFGHQIASDY